MARCNYFSGRRFNSMEERFTAALEKTYDLYINDTFISKIYLTPNNVFEGIIGFLYTKNFISKLVDIIQIYADDNVIKAYVSAPSNSSLDYEKDYSPKTSYQTLKLSYIEKILDSVNSEMNVIKSGCSFHIAKLISSSGIELYAYDTSRHFLIDKLIGIGLYKKIDFNTSLIITTARLSGSIVYKAIKAKIPCLISLRGPISSGIELALKHNIVYISHVRRKGFVVFSGFNKLEWDS